MTHRQSRARLRRIGQASQLLNAGQPPAATVAESQLGAVAGGHTPGRLSRVRRLLPDESGLFVEHGLVVELAQDGESTLTRDHLVPWLRLGERRRGEAGDDADREESRA